MEQDEVYHRAMDEAGRKIQDGKGGVDKDGRPLADAAKRQRQAIQAEQVPFRLVRRRQSSKAGRVRGRDRGVVVVGICRAHSVL